MVNAEQLSSMVSTPLVIRLTPASGMVLNSLENRVRFVAALHFYLQ